MAFIKSELSNLHTQIEFKTIFKGNKSVNQIITESNISLLKKEPMPNGFQFDIFLSHRYSDKIYVYGVFEKLSNYGYRVYVDWINDQQLDRNKVNKDTANLLKIRMCQSKCLLYLTSENHSNSKWMPWELGYMDGHNEKSAILPIFDSQPNNYEYKGQEYLGAYPYMIEAPIKDSQINNLWIFESQNYFVLFNLWLRGEKPYRH